MNTHKTWICLACIAAFTGALAAQNDEEPITVKEAVDQLLKVESVWGPDAEAIFDKVTAANLLDKLVEEAEERADAMKEQERPQTLHALVLMMKLDKLNPKTLGEKKDQGALSIKANKYLNRATDFSKSPSLWDAYLTKAVNYVRWPKNIVGEGVNEKGEHILKTLIKKQEDAFESKRLTPEQRPYYAKTYYYLGDYYARNSNNFKAKRIWKDGLKWFPNDEGLNEKLGN